jgi:hypothetical protein
MDGVKKIVLGESKTVSGVNEEVSLKVKLSSESRNSFNSEYQNVLDVSQVYDDERQASQEYRILGEVEYISLHNNVNISYSSLGELYEPTTGSTDLKTLLTDFDIYMVVPHTDYTELNNNRYIENYRVVGIPSDFSIQKAGYSTNIFGEQQYSLVYNNTLDVTDTYDAFEFPLKEAYIFFRYNPSNSETMSRRGIDDNGNYSGTVSLDGNESFNYDQIISFGNVITYDEFNYNQTLYIEMEYLITLPNAGDIQLKYKPFYKLNLNVFETQPRRINTGSTVYEDGTLPLYATNLGDGNFVWREFLDKGYIDPIDEVGLDYPFINKKHYVFNNIVLNLVPDLDDTTTINNLGEIKIDGFRIINSIPNGDFDNLSKLC